MLDIGHTEIVWSELKDIPEIIFHMWKERSDTYYNRYSLILDDGELFVIHENGLSMNTDFLLSRLNSIKNIIEIDDRERNKWEWKRN